MNETLLSLCRVCGQMISKNLSWNGCPNCGEIKPHSTVEIVISVSLIEIWTLIKGFLADG